MKNHSAFDDREIRIIKTAKSLFLQYGFGGVSTALLAKEARTSKSTLYNRFGSMNGVLDAVVKSEELSVEQGFCLSVDSQDEFINALTKFGENLLNFLNGPNFAIMDNMLAEYGSKDNEAGKRFYNLSYQSSHDYLQQILQEGLSKKYIHYTGDVSFLAETLLSSLEGLRNIKARFNVQNIPYPDVKSSVNNTLELIVNPLLIEAND